MQSSVHIGGFVMQYPDWQVSVNEHGVVVLYSVQESESKFPRVL